MKLFEFSSKPEQSGLPGLICLEVIYVQTQVLYSTLINENRCDCKKNELQSLTFPLDISQTKKDRKLQKKRLKILFPDLKNFLGFQSGRIVNINNQKFSLMFVRIIMHRVLGKFMSCFSIVYTVKWIQLVKCVQLDRRHIRCRFRFQLDMRLCFCVYTLFLDIIWKKKKIAWWYHIYIYIGLIGFL